jgi:hypothetical protein
MKTDKETIKELNEELSELREHMTVFSRKLYAVRMSIWEGGSGLGNTVAICKNIKDATLVSVGLRRTLPAGFSTECGDTKISRDIRIEIEPMFIHDVRDFVKEEKW